MLHPNESVHNIWFYNLTMNTQAKILFTILQLSTKLQIKSLTFIFVE